MSVLVHRAAYLRLGGYVVNVIYVVLVFVEGELQDPSAGMAV